PDLGRVYDGFFRRALARSPDGRFQSADDLASAFSAAADEAAGAPDDSEHAPTIPIPIADVTPAAVSPTAVSSARLSPSRPRRGTAVLAAAAVLASGALVGILTRATPRAEPSPGPGAVMPVGSAAVDPSGSAPLSQDIGGLPPGSTSLEPAASTAPPPPVSS